MSQEKILEILCDLANALEAAAVNVKHQISELQGVQKELKSLTGSAPTGDSAQIKWEQKQGTNGPYERSVDADSPALKILIEDLEAHKGKLSRDGFFYWIFQDRSTVGRKKRT